MSQDEVEERRLHMLEVESRLLEARKQEMEESSREQALEELSANIQELGAKARTAEILEAKVRAAEEQAARRQKIERRIALVASPLLVGLILVSVWRAWRSPASLVQPEQGSSPEVARYGGSSSLGDQAVTEFLNAPEPLHTHEGVTTELPSGPLPGQRLPPCKRPQIEINGGCWILVGNEGPPCVASTYEWKKRCYWPAPAPPRPGTSGVKEPPE